MITQEALKNVLTYDASTGHMIWKNGKRAGSVNKSSGYRYVKINRIGYLEHRLIWLYVHGYWPTTIDHRNHQRDDNRLLNLREASRSENQGHRYKAKKNPWPKGVRRVGKRRFGATIYKDGTAYYLGTFDTPGKASAAYAKKAKELFDKFAKHGNKRPEVQINHDPVAKAAPKGVSGIKGVTWHPRIEKWQVRALDESRTHLGYYDTLDEARAALERAEPTGPRKGRFSKGVVQVRNRYAARVTRDGRKVHLGVFDTPEEAARAVANG